MKPFFWALWNDQAAFMTMAVAIGRGLCSLMGALITLNVIPTGIDGGGKWGILMMVASQFVPAGAYNRGPAKPGQPVEAAPPTAL